MVNLIPLMISWFACIKEAVMPVGLLSVLRPCVLWLVFVVG